MMKTPKIDKRTYEQLVGQLEILANTYTTQTVPPEERLLTGRVIDQPVDVLAQQGEQIDHTLAWQIGQVLDHTPVLVESTRPDTPTESIYPPVDTLTGRVLGQNVIGTENDPIFLPAPTSPTSPTTTEARALLITSAQATTLRQIAGLETVEVAKWEPAGTTPLSYDTTNNTYPGLGQAILGAPLQVLFKKGTPINTLEMAEFITDLLAPNPPSNFVQLQPHGTELTRLDAIPDNFSGNMLVDGHTFTKAPFAPRIIPPNTVMSRTLARQIGEESGGKYAIFKVKTPDGTFNLRPPAYGNLLGRVLECDITAIVAPQGATITDDATTVPDSSARRLGRLLGSRPLKIEGQTDPIAPPLDYLSGRTLAQDIIAHTKQTIPPAQVQAGQSLVKEIRLIATKGTKIDMRLSQILSQLPNLPTVKVEKPGGGVDVDIVDTKQLIDNVTGKTLSKTISLLIPPQPITPVLAALLGTISSKHILASNQTAGQPPELISLPATNLAGRQLLTPLNLTGWAVNQPVPLELTNFLYEHDPTQLVHLMGATVHAKNLATEGHILAQDVLAPVIFAKGTTLTPPIVRQLFRQLRAPITLTVQTPAGQTQQVKPLIAGQTFTSSIPTRVPAGYTIDNTGFFRGLAVANTNAAVGVTMGGAQAQLAKALPYWGHKITQSETDSQTPISIASGTVTNKLISNYRLWLGFFASVTLQPNGDEPTQLTYPLDGLTGNTLTEDLHWPTVMTIPAGTPLNADQTQHLHQIASTTPLQVINPTAAPFYPKATNPTQHLTPAQAHRLSQTLALQHVSLVSRWEKAHLTTATWDTASSTYKPDLTNYHLTQDLLILKGASQNTPLTAPIIQQLQKLLDLRFSIFVNGAESRMPSQLQVGDKLDHAVSNLIARQGDLFQARWPHLHHLFGNSLNLALQNQQNRQITISTPLDLLTLDNTLPETIPLLATQGTPITPDLAFKLSRLPHLESILVQGQNGSEPIPTNTFKDTLAHQTLDQDLSLSIFPHETPLTEQQLKAWLAIAPEWENRYLITFTDRPLVKQFTTANLADIATAKILTRLDTKLTKGTPIQPGWHTILSPFSHNPNNTRRQNTVRLQGQNDPVRIAVYATEGHTLAQDIIAPLLALKDHPLTVQQAQTIRRAPDFSTVEVRQTLTGPPQQVTPLDPEKDTLPIGKDLLTPTNMVVDENTFFPIAETLDFRAFTAYTSKYDSSSAYKILAQWDQTQKGPMDLTVSTSGQRNELSRRIYKYYGLLDIVYTGNDIGAYHDGLTGHYPTQNLAWTPGVADTDNPFQANTPLTTELLTRLHQIAGVEQFALAQGWTLAEDIRLGDSEVLFPSHHRLTAADWSCINHLNGLLAPLQLTGFLWHIAETRQVPPDQADLQGQTLAQDITLFAESGTVVSRTLAQEIGRMFGDHIQVAVQEQTAPVNPPTPDNLTGKKLAEMVSLTAQETIMEAGTEIYHTLTTDQVNRANSLYGFKPDLQVVSRWQAGAKHTLPLDSPDLTRTLLQQPITLSGRVGDLITTQLTRKLSQTLPPPTLLRIHDKAGRTHLVNIPRNTLTGRVLAQDISPLLASKNQPITAELAHRLSLGIGSATQISVKPHSPRPETIIRQGTNTFAKTIPLNKLKPGQPLSQSIPVFAAKGTVISAQLAAQLAYLPGLTHVLVEQSGASPRPINVLNYDADLIGKTIASSGFAVSLRQPVPIDALLNTRLQQLKIGTTFVVSGSQANQPPELKTATAGAKEDLTGRVLLSPLDITFAIGETFQEAWLPFLRRYHGPDGNGITIQDGTDTRNIGFDGYALTGKTLAQDIFPPDPLPAGTPITPQLAWQLSQSVVLTGALSILDIKDTPTGTTQTVELMTSGASLGSKRVTLEITSQPINTYDNFSGALKAARATTADDYGQLYIKFLSNDSFSNAPFLQKFIDLWKTNGSAPVSLGDARTTTILGGGGNLGGADFFTLDTGLLAIPLDNNLAPPDKLSAPLYHLDGRYLAKEYVWATPATIPAGTPLTESQIIALQQHTKLKEISIRVSNLLARVLCDDIASTSANNNPLYPAGTQLTVPQAKRINNIIGLSHVEVSLDWPANAILGYTSHNDKLVSQIAGKFLAKPIYLVAHQGDPITQPTLDFLKQSNPITSFRLEPIPQLLPLSEVILTGRELNQDITLQRAESIATLDNLLTGRVLAQTTPTQTPGTPLTSAIVTTLKNQNLPTVVVYRANQPRLLNKSTALTPAIAQRLSHMAGLPDTYQLLGWQYTPSVPVANNPTELTGRVLDQNINILAPAGTYITPQLAQRIAQTNLQGVKIVATSQPTPATPAGLTSHTLAQDISHTLPQGLLIRTPAIARTIITASHITGQQVPTTAGNRPARLAEILGQTLSQPLDLPGQLLYPKDTTLTPDQAQRICQIAGLRTLQTTTNTYNTPLPTPATLVGQQLKQDLFVAAQQGDRIDEELATIISAVVNDPAGTIQIAVTSRLLQPAITALKGQTLNQATPIIAHKGERIDSDLAQRIIAHYPSFVGPRFAIQGQKEPVPLSQLTASDKLAHPLTNVQLKAGTTISADLRKALLTVLLAKIKIHVTGNQYIPVLAQTGGSPRYELTNKILAQTIFMRSGRINKPISDVRENTLKDAWAKAPLSLPVQVGQAIDWQTISQASDLKGKLLGMDIPFVIPAGTKIASPLTRFILTHYTRLNLADSPGGTPTITNVTHLTDIADKYLIDPIFVVAPAGTTITTDTFATLLFQNGGILNLLLRQPQQSQDLTTLASPFPLYNDTLAQDIAVGNVAEYPAGTPLKAGTPLTADQANHLSHIAGLPQIRIFNSTEIIAKAIAPGRILAQKTSTLAKATPLTQAHIATLPAYVSVYSNPLLVTNRPVLLTNQILAEDLNLLLTSGTKLNATTLNQLQHHPQLRRIRVTTTESERVLNTPNQLVGRTLNEALYLGRVNEVITPRLAELLCQNRWPGLTTATCKRFTMVANRIDQLTGKTAGQYIPNLVQIGDPITPTLAQQISQIRSLPQVLVWETSSPTDSISLTPNNISQLTGRVLAQTLIPFPAQHTLTLSEAQLIAKIADLPSLAVQRHQPIPLTQLTSNHTLAQNISGLLARQWAILDPILAQALFIFRNTLKTIQLYPDVPDVLTRNQTKTASLRSRIPAADTYRVYNKGYTIPNDNVPPSIALAYAPHVVIRIGASQESRSIVHSGITSYPLAQTFTFTIPAGTPLTDPLRQLLHDTLTPHIPLQKTDGTPLSALPNATSLLNTKLANDTLLILRQGERLSGTLATLTSAQLQTDDILWVESTYPSDPPLAKRQGDSLDNCVLAEDWDVLVPAGTPLTDNTLITYLIAHTLPHFPVQSRAQSKNLEHVTLLPQALTGRRLWSDLHLTLPAGTPITSDPLALRIGRNLPTPTATLQLTPSPKTIRPLIDPLIGQTLAQPVLALTPPHTPIAQRGLILDKNTAQTLSQIAGLKSVCVRARPGLHAHDLGATLIRLTAHFSNVIIDRLNRTPNKAYLDYLNFIGSDLLPAQPAQAPLTFQLAQGSPIDGLVPPHTQISAPPQTASTNETVFETQEPLIVTSSQLQAVVTRQFITDFHDNDQYTFDHNYYTDYTPQALGHLDQPFPIFQVGAPQGQAINEIDHTLYLACPELQHMAGLNDVTLQIHSPVAQHLSILPYNWAYWDKDTQTWLTLDPARVQPQPPANNVWAIQLKNIPPLKPHKINGQLGTWLRLRLDLTLPPPQTGLLLDKYTNNANNNISDPQPTAQPFYPFGQQASDKVTQFYLSGTNIFPRKGAHVTLNIKLAQAGAGATALQGKYYQQSSRSWVDLAHFNDSTSSLSKDGAISFALPVDVLWTILEAKYTGCWLQFTHTGIYTTYPQIASITADYGWQFGVSKIDVKLNPAGSSPTTHQLIPQHAYANAQHLDLTRPFYPFNKQPDLYDTLYLAYDPLLTNGGIKAGDGIKIQVDIVQEGHNGSPTLEWQCWDGYRWQTLTLTNDGTNHFTTVGNNKQITFTLPTTLTPTTINGQTAHWIRIILNSGNYGTSGYFTNDSPPRYTQPTFRPPVISNLVFLVDPPTFPLSACWSHNDFAYTDHTRANQNTTDTFIPFTPTPDFYPTMYLGFDKPFADQPISLYAQVTLPDPDEVPPATFEEEQALHQQPALVWEYATAQGGWKHLAIEDGTHSFSGRGIIRFIGPVDLTSRPLFGQTAYWLRVRKDDNCPFLVQPRLHSWRLNTTWAKQVQTIHNEIIGSSNGQPNQTFQLNLHPILPGAQIDVREPAEMHLQDPTLQAQTNSDPAGFQDQGIWLRWQAVPHFYRSTPNDRHYTLNPITGQIRFGNGKRGLIPPVGHNSIRATAYESGGGLNGNRPSHTIQELKTTLPYIDSVDNLEPATGGAARETIAEIETYGPRTLRHRGRAVTAQDLEDLAHQASPDIARAQASQPTAIETFEQLEPAEFWLDPTKKPPADTLALHNDFQRGAIGLIIVPESSAVQPTPSLALLDRVRRYLSERASPTARLWVSGPDWVRVSVNAAIVPASLDASVSLTHTVLTTLDRYLHPLTGGPAGKGWPFGRVPYTSDLYALLGDLPSVDHISVLSITLHLNGQNITYTATDDLDQLAKLSHRNLLYAGTHTIEIIT